MNCIHCGQPMASDSRFCANCGTPTSLVPPPPQSSKGGGGMSLHYCIMIWLNIVYRGIGLLIGLLILAFFSVLGNFIPQIARTADAHFPFPLFFSGLGLLIFLFILLISLPGLAAGIGLLKFYGWARIIMLIVAFLDLPWFPLGTLLGGYTLWVLLSQEGQSYFRQQSKA